MPVIQHLQKDVEHIWVSLFDLVKEYDRIRVGPHPVAELAAFFISYISRRRADQLGYRVLFHILRHIYPDHCFIASEKSFRQSL